MSIFDQTSSLFNKPAESATQKPKLDLFGSMSLQVPKPANSGSSLFGSASATATQPQSSGLFGASTAASQPQSTGGLFGSSTANNQTSTGGGLFGNSAPAAQAQSSGGLFGSNTQQTGSSGLFGAAAQPAQQQQQAGSGLFGAPKPAGSGLFGSTQPAQQNGGLFGSSQPAQQGGGLFGSTQPAQQGGGLFGSTQPAPQSNGLFGNASQQQAAQSQQQQGSMLGQQPSVLISQSQLFPQTDSSPRHKPIPQQIELAFSKWNPESPSTSFSTYLYNSVPAHTASFYGPGQTDNTEKWEAALASAPTPNSVPVQVRGFEQLALRMKTQYQNIEILQGRLHEINSGLEQLLSKHNLDLLNRIGALRRNHTRLARQTLSLAAKTQILRNRGYALDAQEEDLKGKLLGLEKGVRDPELEGRGEEIWARLVGVRERAKLLGREMKKLGEGGGDGGSVDPEVVSRAKKILEDYAAQIEHLSKEMATIEKEWKEWVEGSLGGRGKGFASTATTGVNGRA